jgi:hypothetical protein
MSQYTHARAQSANLNQFQAHRDRSNQSLRDRKRRRSWSRRRIDRLLTPPFDIIGVGSNPNPEQLRLRKMSRLPFTPRPVWVRPQNNYGSNRWVVFSPKLGRTVILYSDLERDHWVLVEADPRILLFCEQPLRISVRLASGPVGTIFDMWLRWREGHEELREVKYKDHVANSSRASRQLEAQATWTSLVSFPYSVMTEDVIRANPIFLANWKRILCYLGTTSRANVTRELDQVRSLLAKFGPMPMVEIERRLSQLDCMLVRTAIFTLIHAGETRALGIEERSLDGFTLVEEVRDANK